MLELNGLRINVIAVLAATVANFLVGFIWYSQFFEKPWAKEMGYDPDMRPSPKGMMRGMILNIVGNFLFAWVLAFYLAGWKFIPGMAEFGALPLALNSALSVWIGFFLPVHLSQVAWEKHSWTLFFINSGYHPVATAMIALILAYWI